MFFQDIDVELKDLTFNFFYKFSRFEYSLKANKFGKPEGKFKRAMADWPRFRKEYEDNYILSVEATMLLQNPPKLQVLDNDKIKFITEEHEKDDSDLRKVIRSVQRIRNNLFHGGKEGCGSEGEVTRNKFLLSKGCEVLDQLAKLDVNVDYDYPGAY